MKRVPRKPTIPSLSVGGIERKAEIQRLRELLPSLGDEEIAAMYFRFWESLLIEEIAGILGRSWDYTDQLIERSIWKLRQGFREIPTKRQPIAA